MKIGFDPQSGHEQAGWRPALVVSPALYNRASSLALLCPIASRAKGYPFEVALPAGFAVSGVVLADVNSLTSGTHVITATATDSQGRSTTATITIVVNAAPTVSISLTFSGGVLRLVGTANDLEDGTISSAIQWTSSIDGAIGTGANISTAGVSPGTHTITATVTDSGSKTATAPPR